MTEDALEGGLKMLLDKREGFKFTEFPPNALQFRALCHAYYEHLNLPKASDAYREVQQYELHGELPHYAHTVVRYIASRLPESFFEEENFSKKRDLFMQVYNKICDLAQSGHAIPDVSVKFRKKKQNRTVGLMHLNDIRQRLGMRMSEVRA